jgi:hypothetical protein
MMSGCIECPSSDRCNTCGKHDPADSEMTRVKEFWTIIDKVLKHVPQTLATEARLIAAIGLQAAVRIGRRQATDWLQAGGAAQVQYTDGTVEEMPVSRAIAITALEQLTGTPFRGSPNAPASSEVEREGDGNPPPSPSPTNQARWTPRVVS